MPKQADKIEGTVCRDILHQGEHVPAGSDLDLEAGTARMLEGAGQFTTSEEGRKAAKRAASARAAAVADGASVGSIESGRVNRDLGAALEENDALKRRVAELEAGQAGGGESEDRKKSSKGKA